jgi:hypothetical protein
MALEGGNGELTVMWDQCTTKRVRAGIKLPIFIVATVQEALQVVGPNFLHLPSGDVFREFPCDFNSRVRLR